MAKRARSRDSDIISNLPTNIRERILTSLPLQEAVRASILSRKWRHCWIKLPNLVFDDTIRQVEATNHNDLLARYKFVSIINQILLLHQGPIRKFSFSHSVLLKGPEIDHIMTFLSKSSVEEFDFKIRTGKYTLPSSFFSFKELKHLDLSACAFSPPPEFRGFRKLISLKFVYVDLRNSFFGTFISNCPKLERLTLINLSGYSFVLRAPNLKYLHYEVSGQSYFNYGSVLQSPASVPGHSSGKVYKSLKAGKKYRLVEFFASLPSMNNLIMDQSLLEHLAADGIPMKLPNPTKLEVLELNQILLYDLDNLLCLYSLIGSSPSLQRIKIEMVSRKIGDEAPVMDFPKARDYGTDVTFDELRDVRLMAISGMDSELELIKLLLARSPVLENMVIMWPQLRDDTSRLKLLKKLTRFQRASSMAMIIFE